MHPKPPSFGEQDYWNKRFTSNPEPFEWLEAPTALDLHITEALKASDERHPQLLHIGCGTSLLSFHLRAHVDKPEQIHNLDYSSVAVEVGRKREADIFKAEAPATEARNGFLDEVGVKSSQHDQPEPNDTTEVAPAQPVMKWSSANLLDHASLLEACRPSTYSVIVDKSTTDSIACSDDLYVPLPYHLVTSPMFSSKTTLTESSEPLHPVHIMAVHLALVTKPRGRWIALSYSADRYPFLQLQSGNASCNEAGDKAVRDDDLDDIPEEVIKGGFPDPSTLWRLVGRYEVEPQAPPEDLNNNALTHRPKVSHWIYVLERTDVPIFVRF